MVLFCGGWGASGNNGHICVDGEKMAKSKGNFLTLEYVVQEFSCDATRIAMADQRADNARETMPPESFHFKCGCRSCVQFPEHLTKELLWDAVSLGLIQAPTSKVQFFKKNSNEPNI